LKSVSDKNNTLELGILTNARSSCGLLFVTAVGQQIASKKGDYCTQHTFLSATKRMRQPSTSSLLVCSPGNSGSASCNPRICPLWHPFNIPSPLLSGGRSLGGRCRGCLEWVLILWSYFEPRSYGSIGTPACSTDRHQVSNSPYSPSKMNLIPG